MPIRRRAAIAAALDRRRGHRDRGHRGHVPAEWTAPALQSYDVGVRTFDSLWYHLPWAASFAQTGHIAPLRFTDVEYLTAFYPATAEMLHGLGIVLLGHDTLSPALNLLWLVLALVAAWCIGGAAGSRRRGRARRRVGAWPRR